MCARATIAADQAETLVGCGEGSDVLPGPRGCSYWSGDANRVAVPVTEEMPQLQQLKEQWCLPHAPDEGAISISSAGSERVGAQDSFAKPLPRVALQEAAPRAAPASWLEPSGGAKKRPPSIPAPRGSAAAVSAPPPAGIVAPLSLASLVSTPSAVRRSAADKSAAENAPIAIQLATLVPPPVAGNAEALSVTQLLRWRATEREAEKPSELCGLAAVPAAEVVEERWEMPPSPHSSDSSLLTSAEERTRPLAARRRASRRATEEELRRKANALLNKVTPCSVNLLASQLLHEEPVPRSAEDLQLLSGLIFNATVTDRQYTDAYAELCGVLATGCSGFRTHDGDKMTLVRALLERCQGEFERLMAPETMPQEHDDMETLLRFKEQALGNIRFMSRLFLRHLLPLAILRVVICQLLFVGARPAELCIECAVALLRSAGPALEAGDAGRRLLREAAERLERLMAGGYSKRIKFQVQDLLEACLGGWDAKDLQLHLALRPRRVGGRAAGDQACGLPHRGMLLWFLRESLAADFAPDALRRLWNILGPPHADSRVPVLTQLMSIGAECESNLEVADAVIVWLARLGYTTWTEVARALMTFMARLGGLQASMLGQSIIAQLLVEPRLTGPFTPAALTELQASRGGDCQASALLLGALNLIRLAHGSRTQLLVIEQVAWALHELLDLGGDADELLQKLVARGVLQGTAAAAAAAKTLAVAEGVPAG